MQGIPQGQNQQGGSQKPSLSWQSPAPSAQTKPVTSHDKPKSTPPVQKPDNKNTETKSATGTYVVIFVAGLVVGGLLGWAITGQRTAPGTASTATSTVSTTSTTGTTDLTGSAMGDELQGLTINSGQDAGATVAVAHIDVTKPTWVIVYDDNAGVPGRVLGAQLFFPTSAGGETSGTVSLIRNTLAGTTYLAGERVDDGDHAYGPASDKLITDANGNPLTITFSIK